MMVQEHIQSAIRSIISNKMRAGLSMLGIIIGVFSIIVMMAIGQGTSNSIMDKFNSMGANLITISPGGNNQSKVGAGSSGMSKNTSLINDDFVDYTKQIPGVTNVSPTVSASRQFIYNSYNTNAQIL